MVRSIKKLGILMLIVVFSFALMFPIMTSTNIKAEAAENGVLYVLNWGDYIDDSLIEEFETLYKVDVKYSTADTNEIMLNKLLNSDDKIDVLCPSDYAIEKLIKKDKLLKLNKDKLDNEGNIEQRLYEKMNEVFGGNAGKGNMDEYMVPYMYGTLGVLYNTEAISKAEAEKAGYGILWNTTGEEKLNKKVMMKDSVRDALVAAVLHLKEINKLPEKYSKMTISELINNTDDELIKLAEEILVEQKKTKALKKYEVDDGKVEMEKGTAYANLAWSGDAIDAMSNNDKLDYFVPEVGGNIWFDGWVINKKAENIEMAHKFIDFMCNPVSAVKNSLYIGYTSAVSQESIKVDEKAVKLFTDAEYDIDEYFADEIAYPDLDDPKLAVMRDYGTKEAQIITMWERVKSAGNLSKTLGIVFGVIGGVLVIVILVVIVLKNTSRKGKLAKPAQEKTQTDEDEEYEDNEENQEEDDSDSDGDDDGDANGDANGDSE